MALLWGRLGEGEIITLQPLPHCIGLWPLFCIAHNAGMYKSFAKFTKQRKDFLKPVLTLVSFLNGRYVALQDT